MRLLSVVEGKLPEKIFKREITTSRYHKRLVLGLPSRAVQQQKGNSTLEKKKFNKHMPEAFQHDLQDTTNY